MLLIRRIPSLTLLMGLTVTAPLTGFAELVYRPDAPLPIPSFTCSNAADPSPTAGALKNPGQVLNTNAVSISDRGNQQRWAYAFDPAAPGSHTIPQATAGATEEIPTSFTLPGNVVPAALSSLPALAWQHFSGREVFAYNGGTATSPQLGTGQSLGSVGFYTANPNGGAASNQTRFLRYQFYLAPEADAASYQLTLGGVGADDQIAGYYINGVLSGTNPVLGAGATADLQWKTGLNTLTIALFDTIPSATRLVVGNASSSACILQTLAVNVAVQDPVITTAQTETFSGIATVAAPGSSTPTPLPVGTQVGLTLTGPNGFSASQNTTVTGTAGEYSLIWPAGLEPGSYEVIAHLSDQPTVQSDVGRFTVEAVVVPPPPPPPSGPTPTPSVPPTPATPTSVPSLSQWSLALLTLMLGGFAAMRVRRSRMN